VQELPLAGEPASPAQAPPRNPNIPGFHPIRNGGGNPFGGSANVVGSGVKVGGLPPVPGSANYSAPPEQQPTMMPEEQVILMAANRELTGQKVALSRYCGLLRSA
jgi:hypothetical protein